MIAALRQSLLENWSAINPQQRRPETLSFIQRKRRERVLWYVFEPGRDSPSIFVKMMRFRDRDHILRDEHRVASRLIPLLSECRTFTPVPSGSLLTVDGRSLLARSYFLEPTMSSTPSRFFENWKTLTKVALEIQRRTRDSKENACYRVRDEYKRFRKAPPTIVNLEPLDRLFEENSLSQLVPWGGLAHADLGCNNILIGHDGRYRILDWEYAAPAQPPLYDSVYFVVHWAYYFQESLVKRHATECDPTGVITYCLSERTSFGRRVRRSLCALYDEQALPKESLRFTLAYCCVRQLNLISAGTGYDNDKQFFSSLLQSVAETNLLQLPS
jgi:hypothetical protein